MNIKCYCPRWGSEHINWPHFLSLVKSAGYDGIEYAIPGSTTKEALDLIWDLAAKHGLEIIAQHYDSNEPNFKANQQQYASWLEKMMHYPVVKLNSQTGKDYFSSSQNTALIELANQYSEQTGIAVVHETHRNKFSFAAHQTRKYLKALPNLRITLDASHWVCVAESYLEDQQAAMTLAIQRTDHIHARVGYPEGPQVTDPFLPEWEAALNAHLNWWDQVVAVKKEQQETELTITPEYGPYPYAIQMPLSRVPLASQWDINVAMMNFLKNRYE